MFIIISSSIVVYPSCTRLFPAVPSVMAHYVSTSWYVRIAHVNAAWQCVELFLRFVAYTSFALVRFKPRF